MQADIFSLGILMYMVLTGGMHPFDELEFKSEIDKAFAEVITLKINTNFNLILSNLLEQLLNNHLE